MGAADVVAASAQGSPCRRAPAKAWSRPDTIIIGARSPAPCTLRFGDLPTAIQGDGDRVPFLGQRLARDQRGRLYASTGDGQVGVWSAAGRLLTVFGRAGQGPGEFARGPLTIHTLRDGRVFVFDNARRWSIFDSSFAFQRLLNLPFGLGDESTVVLDDGTVLDAQRLATSNKFFAVAKLDDQRTAGDQGAGWRIIRSFGDVPERERIVSKTNRVRRIAYAGGATFWSGPPVLAGRGYELQEWTTSGVLRRTIRRVASWYPPGIDIERSRSMAGRSPDPGEVELVFAFGDGLVWVALRVTDATSWQRMQRSPLDTTLQNRAYNIHYELIDTDAGMVVADGSMTIGNAVAQLPSGWFHGSNTGYRVTKNADGERVVRLVEARLYAR